MSQSDKTSFQAGEVKGEAKVMMMTDALIAAYLLSVFLSCPCRGDGDKSSSGSFQEKGNQMMDKVSNAAQSTKETCQEVQVFFNFLLFFPFHELH